MIANDNGDDFNDDEDAILIDIQHSLIWRHLK